MQEFNEKLEILGDEDLFVNNGGYSQAYRCVLKMKGLSPVAKVLYTYLLSYKGIDNKIYPSQRTIMDDLEIKDAKRLRKYINELQTFGLLRVVKDASRGRYAHTRYYLAESFKTMEQWKKDYEQQDVERQEVKETPVEEVHEIENTVEQQHQQMLHKLITTNDDANRRFMQLQMYCKEDFDHMTTLEIISHIK